MLVLHHFKTLSASTRISPIFAWSLSGAVPPVVGYCAAADISYVSWCCDICWMFWLGNAQSFFTLSLFFATKNYWAAGNSCYCLFLQGLSPKAQRQYHFFHDCPLCEVAALLRWTWVMLEELALWSVALATRPLVALPHARPFTQGIVSGIWVNGWAWQVVFFSFLSLRPHAGT